MNMDKDAPEPGRYIGHGDGTFSAMCANCGVTLDRLSWGQAGSQVVPRRLRSHGWKMHGATVNAFWVCADCPLPSSAPKPVVCYDCGLPYGGDHWVEAVVPHDVWALISPSGNEGGILCINCMAARLARLGVEDVPLKITAGPFHHER